MSSKSNKETRSVQRSVQEMMAQTIRGLTMDAVQAANSGHPGMPMGTAEMAAALWTQHLMHDPSCPAWPDRDRFVLSAGHGSMLQYALLHLSGYDLPLDELRNFRQWDSKTPGHPEYGHTVGVEVTTGPLGTGFGTGVGLAIAERYLGARYNRPEHSIVDHMTYAIVSDGDLMEGVCAEAASLAGHLQLGKLVYLYDDNEISIDGDTGLCFGEDVKARFEAYGWHVERIDGHDLDALNEAIAKARATSDRPSLICCKTVIGKGSPNKAGKSAAHGAPLGPEEVEAAKKSLGLPSEPFFVAAEFRTAMSALADDLKKTRLDWEQRFEAYKKAHPDLAKEYQSMLAGELPSDLFDKMPAYEVGKAIATRSVSGEVINALSAQHPNFIGGSADLAGSNKTLIREGGVFGRETPDGKNIYFGVREHAMATVCNGITLHGGLRCFDATFLIFSDFMRGALRLSALMNLPVVHVLTHDSFWVGEDGPTHQPIEQTMSLRLIPNLEVYRPADANETVGAWKAAMERKDGPSAILLSRQNLPVLENTRRDLSDGAYVVHEPEGLSSPADLDGILIASGSEVALAIEAARSVQAQALRVRVVSMPCWERFAALDAKNQEQVLPAAIPLAKRISLEAGATLGWERYAGHPLGIDHFGASAPGKVLAEKFGFSVEAVSSRLREILGSARA